MSMFFEICMHLKLIKLMEWIKYEIGMKYMEKSSKYCKNKEIIKGEHSNVLRGVQMLLKGI